MADRRALPRLGKVRRVGGREAWPHEATHFTPWLASPEGLELLRGALAMDLELEGTEQFVGPFKADIVARRTDTPDEPWVLIENQLERSNHGHLGQLLTYAACLKAATVVWVAEHFCEEHRAALGWLNELTGRQCEFYGLEIGLWQIGNSPPAPMFTVIAQPNGSPREPRPKVDGTVTDLKQLQQRFWHGVRVRLLEKKSKVRPPKALPQYRATYALGRAGVWLSATINTSRKLICVEFVFEGPPGKAWFQELEAQQAAIERDFGPGLSWQILDGNKRSRIARYREHTDATNEADWPAQHAWIVETLEKFYAVFQPRALALSDWAAGGDDDSPGDGGEGP